MSYEFFAKVLTLKDFYKWSRFVRTTPRTDVFYLPEYLAAFEKVENVEILRNFGGSARLFVYGNAENFVIYPFFIRDLNLLPFYKNISDQFKPIFDIVSPYGYSGPAVRVEDQNILNSLFNGFYKSFNEYCMKQNIVCEFTRMHPLLENARFAEKGNLLESGKIVYIDLEPKEGKIFSSFTKACRGSLKKAMREGVEIYSSKGKDEILEFFKLYNETMARHNANLSYLFPLSFYSDIASMKESFLFLAKHKGVVINAALFFEFNDFAQYYLSGSESKYRSFSGNNAIIWEFIRHAKSRGCKKLCLGGGYRGSESLMKFKLSFSKKTAPFYIYRKVQNPISYNRICDIAGVNPERQDYFPAYRN